MRNSDPEPGEAWRPQVTALLQERGALHGDWLPPALEPVARSWQRSLSAGLRTQARSEVAHLSAFELARATERQHELIACARPVMAFLHGQTRDTRSIVMLADGGGLLLQALGDTSFMNRAASVALQPGAVWHEQHRGTNAIGTALAEQAPVVVHGGEHFLDCNSFLTCAAAPLMGPDGRLMGVLDMSGECGQRVPQAMALVRQAAQMIESSLFASRHARHWRVHLHPLLVGLGSAAEAMLAVDAQGTVVGANANALPLLALGPQHIGQLPLQQVLHIGLQELCTRSGGALQPLRIDMAPASPSGQMYAWVEEPAAAPRPVPAAQPPRLPAAGRADALAALDTGDARWRQLLATARRVMGQALPLLLHGESGTGKEVLARAIHRAGPRAGGPFVAVNCAALPEGLIEAELFGYAPGAYTGADRRGAPGRIRQAHGGTLLLDEIGDMPLPLQARLLRVLQEREVTPLGATASAPVDFDLICASHRHLPDEVAAGRFRADLYWRVNGLTLLLPPLRERTDLPAIAQALLAKLAPGRPLALSAQALATLAAQSWPGNIRQLDNVLRAAVALLEPDALEIGPAQLPTLAGAHAPWAMAQAQSPSPLQTTAQPAPAAVQPWSRQRQAAARQAVEAAQGNHALAARTLGIGRSTLYRWLRAQD